MSGFPSVPAIKAGGFDGIEVAVLDPAAFSGPNIIRNNHDVPELR